MKIYLQFFKYFLPYKKTFCIALLLLLISGASSGIGLPSIFQNVLARFYAPENIRMIILIAACIPLFFMLRGVFGFLGSFLLSKCSLQMSMDMRMTLFKKIQSLPIAFFSKNSSGDTVVKLSSDAFLVQDFILNSAKELVQQSTQSMFAFGYLFYMAFQQTQTSFLILFIAFSPAMIYPAVLIGKNLKRRGRQVQETSVGMTQHLLENLSGVEEVRAFGLEKQQTQNYLEKCKSNLLMQLKVVKYELFQQPSMEITVAFVIAIALALACINRMPLENFMGMSVALYLAVDPLKRVAKLYNEGSKRIGSAQRVLELLNSEETVKDLDNPTPIGRLNGNIEYNDVYFAYGAEYVINGVTLKILAGKYAAFVGHSGAGKSTLAKLVPRFYDVSEGSLSIDGINVRKMRQGDLRKNIAFVSQSPLLFNDTVLNNILMGNSDATKEQVYEAAKSAYAYDFILKDLPNGFDTIVGERGASLSGGQRQRIALARAFLRNAPILVLDEATSALDSESEYYIKLAIEKLGKGRTVIAIAHRLSTIKNADIIFVIGGGRIIAQGTHEELLADCEEYKNIVLKQQL